MDDLSLFATRMIMAVTGAVLGVVFLRSAFVARRVVGKLTPHLWLMSFWTFAFALTVFDLAFGGHILENVLLESLNVITIMLLGTTAAFFVRLNKVWREIEKAHAFAEEVVKHSNVKEG